MKEEKFFKIPVEKLLERIAVGQSKGITFNESQWGMVDGLENYRFWTHISARRTGKSLAAGILALAKLLEPGTQVMVVAPNFTLSSIIWDYVTDMIRNLQLEVDRFNQKDKIVKLINGSTFRLLSANNRDSLVGRAAHLIIVDEAAIIPDDEYFTRDLRPALSTYPDSRALFISTPRGKTNYLYDYYLRGQNDELLALFIEAKSDTGQLRHKQMEFITKMANKKDVYILVMRDIEELDIWIGKYAKDYVKCLPTEL